MVVLGAAVLAKGGKPLVSRQYMDMSRIRIEGLLAAFPKLVGSGKQHTYVETENVRYIYQPMEGLYLVLITNKQSNILEDLETLRLLSKLVPEFCENSLEEESICRSAFDLIFAFDEVISLGHKENITIMQVRQNCEMESHEEKLHNMIVASKISETKDVMKRKAQEIEKAKLENKSKQAISSMMTGFGSSRPGMGSMESSVSESLPSYAPRSEPAAPASRPAPAANKGPSKGMVLGSKAKKGTNILESLAKEGEVVELEVPSTRPGAAAGASTSVTANLSSEPLTLNIDEKLNVAFDKQGGLETLEVNGTLSLVVNVEDDAYLRVAIAAGANKGFQFRTHPNIDKATYNEESVLALKDPSRPFPTGSELGILKWRLLSKDETLVPLTINCWPSVSGGQSYVNIEYESTSAFELQNVVIAISLRSGPPTVNQCDGEWRYDSKRGSLLWTIDLIDDTNRSGAMEFVVPATDPDSFYPIEVSFTSSKTFCDINIESVTHTQKEGAPAVKYSSKRLLATAEYTVGA